MEGGGRVRLFRRGRADINSAVKSTALDFGALTPPTLLPPSLLPQNLHFIYLSGALRRSEGSSPHPHPFTPAPEGGGEGEEAELRITSRRRSRPDLQQPDPPLKFSTPRLEVRSITEEQQGQRIRCCTCSHFPTIRQPARQQRAITASPPPLLCHHSENAQPPPRALRFAGESWRRGGDGRLPK